MKIASTYFSLVVALMAGEAAAQSIYFVTVDADGGLGSLRQAVLDVNAATPPPVGTRHEIRFEVPEVNLLTELPALNAPVQLRARVDPFMDSATIRGPGTFRLLAVNPGVADGLYAVRISFFGGLSSGDGGAIRAPYVELRYCHFEGNLAARGGAVAAENMQINGCSFLDNTAVTEGGAVCAVGTGVLAEGSVQVVNSTFDRNQAAAGGALSCLNPSGVLVLGQLTLTRNHATTGPAVHAPAVEVKLGNSILAPNTGGTPVVVGSPLTLAGQNLLAGDPGLGEPSVQFTSPAYNRYPLPGSPVIDAAAPLPPGTFPFTGNDARNVSRPFGAGADLGAIENRLFSIPATATLSHSPGGWNDAVAAINAGNADGIDLPAATITFTSQPPEFGPAASLYGRPGSRLDGAGQYQPVKGDGGLHVEGIEFRHCRSTDPVFPAGGAVRIGLNNLRPSLVQDCQFTDNTTQASGGALYVGGGRVTVRRCAFLGNESEAAQGGALAAQSGEVTVENCTFHANRSGFQAAAVECIQALLILRHCTVDSNTSSQNTGHAVECNDSAGRLRILNSVVSRNTNTAGPANVNATGAGEYTVTGSYIGATPGLGSLVLPGGGATAYLPPLQAQPLVDAGDPAEGVAEDQRGLARPEHGLPDIGAIERYTDPYREWLADRNSAADLSDLVRRDDTWAATADGDGDGSLNAIEIALDGDPDEAGVAPTLEIVREAADLRFRLFTRDDTTGWGWTMAVETADQPGATWSALPPGDLVLETSANGFTPLRHTVPPAWTRRVYRAALSGVPRVHPLLTAVGVPGNAADPGNSRGAVARTYLVGRYEVTAGEYAAFLNAVDPQAANALALWQPQMESSSAGGVLRVMSAPAGGRYQVKPGRTRFPANFVTYYAALRYCNWLHNGAVAGADTETGAYLLAGGTPEPANGDTILRETGARFFLPTSDEWFKAAYFVNDLSFGGLGAYADYPNAANTINNLPPPGDSTSANYLGGGFLNTLRAGGEYAATRSAWGAFDMAGNVQEMMQVPFANSVLVLVAGGGYLDTDATRALRGNFGLEAVGRVDPRADVGFRIAAERP